MSAISQFSRAWLDWTFAATWQLALLVCLIGVLTYFLRDVSPRLRYGLWLLVLVKALLPPTLGTQWGVGAWMVTPVVDFRWPIASADADVTTPPGVPSPAMDDIPPRASDGNAATFSAESLLFFVWAGGCLTIWLAVAWRYWRLTHATDSMHRIDEGPARVELERLAARFSVGTVPDLYETRQPSSPMLVGMLRARIILPESIAKRLNPQELRMVLAHELMHWRRNDTWVGWLQVFVQGVFWFHPFVWLANARIRHERECACDETVLREARCDRDGYGETIVRVLTAARGRSLVAGNMVGIFERGSQLQARLEEIMSFDQNKRRFGWISRAALVAAALVLLPMAAPGVQADSAKDSSAAAGDRETSPNVADEDRSSRPRTNWPTIVSTKPKMGATDVDPKRDEITVTFDRDMDVTGYSWTGGAPFFPPGEEGTSPVWVDKRTCVLPVRLKRGSYYRAGINSSNHQSFRSEAGVPAPTSAIYFVTAGATPAVASRVRIPKVVKFSPENGAKNVDPGLTRISVKFDLPMDTSSYSWTGGGPSFPTISEGQKPRWSRDGKTCTLPVALSPGKRYELGLNSLSHKSFASKWGVPLEPVRYEFQTSGDAP